VKTTAERLSDGSASAFAIAPPRSGTSSKTGIAIPLDRAIVSNRCRRAPSPTGTLRTRNRSTSA
jgi:hypothetical protein